jgi:hypothetical protein
LARKTAQPLLQGENTDAGSAHIGGNESAFLELPAKSRKDREQQIESMRRSHILCAQLDDARRMCSRRGKDCPEVEIVGK